MWWRGAVGGSDGGINRGAVFVLLLSADDAVTTEQMISSAAGGPVGPKDIYNFGSSAAHNCDLEGVGAADASAGQLTVAARMCLSYMYAFVLYCYY